MVDASTLLARRDELHADAKRHKRLITFHRDRLHQAMADLQTLEDECRARGIRLVTITRGEGERIHGRDRDDR